MSKYNIRKAFTNRIETFLINVSDFCMLFINIIRMTFRRSFSFKQLSIQMINMGVDSFVVCMITSFFTGMVMALQIAVLLDNVLMGISQYVGTMVGKSMVKELSPMLVALIFAGRIGSSVTAEIGSMKVSEQLDALKTLYTSPVEYVAVPRFWAGLLALPMLTITADIVGMLGGAVVSHFVLRTSALIYIDHAIGIITLGDFLGSIIKGTVFGAEIMIISCFFGFRTTGGAEGVGKATTTSVVWSFMFILITDYLLITILNYFPFFRA